MTDKATETPAGSEPPAYSSTLPGILGIIDTAISRIESFLLAAGVLLMATNVVANVIGRFALNRSIQSSEEINRILIILITFAGISYAARHGRHIRMSAIFDKLPHRPRKVLMIVIALVTAFFMFALAWYATLYILTLQGRGRVLPSLQIPIWLTFLWVPVGFFMTGLQYTLTAVKNMIERDVFISTALRHGYDGD